jgi:transposase
MKGRKPKLTRELIMRASKLLRAGNYVETVAELLGIGKTTFYRWLEEAEERGGLFREFRDAVARAAAEAERNALAVIVRPKTPENAKWFLERRFPDRWGRRVRVEEKEMHPSDYPPPIVNIRIAGEKFVPPTTAGETADQPAQTL